MKPKKNAAQALKLSTRGQVVLRTFNPNSLPDVPGDTNISTTAPVPTTKANGVNLFASSTESCFFRRPACSPDGALLVTPMGIYNPETPNLTHQESGEIAAKSPSYCTHVFSRLSLTHFADVFSVAQQQGAGCAPIYSLVGLEEPSVAVRFCPRVFKNNISTNEFKPVLSGAYRMIFAVVTTSSVYLYDTQHHHPIVKVAGIHYATINDATWTSDGTCLIVCSSDGYVSFLRFNEKDSSVNELGEENAHLQTVQQQKQKKKTLELCYSDLFSVYIRLGEVISIQDTPECIKATFPSLYGAVLKKSGMEHMNDGDSGVIVEPREANEKSISTNVGYHEQLSSLPTPIEGIAPPTSLQSVVADMSSAEIDVDKDAMIVE